MNQAEMRTRFKNRTSGLGDDLSDAEVDAYLDRAYQYTVPADVGGSYSRGTWPLTCVASQITYDIPDYVVMPLGRGVHILSTDSGGQLGQIYWLDVETDDLVWNATDRIFPAVSDIPTSMLIFGRQVFLSPSPDDDYIVNIPARQGPSSGLTSSGLGQENHARAVVAGAAIEFLTDQEDTEGAQREAAGYQDYTRLLRTSSHGMSPHRRPMRSYK